MPLAGQKQCGSRGRPGPPAARNGPISRQNPYTPGTVPAMKAAYYETTGGPEVIRYGDLPQPVPRAGEVLVRVRVAAVNPIDTCIRAGAVAMQLPKPYIPGCDLAGTVEAVGPGVHRFKPGDRVWGSNQGLF